MSRTCAMSVAKAASTRPHSPGRRPDMKAVTRARVGPVRKHTSTSAHKPAQKPARSTGNWNPDWEPFAKLDPAWTEKVIAMAIAPAISGVLDKKTIELIG